MKLNRFLFVKIVYNSEEYIYRNEKLSSLLTGFISFNILQIHHNRIYVGDFKMIFQKSPSFKRPYSRRIVLICPVMSSFQRPSNS